MFFEVSFAKYVFQQNKQLEGKLEKLLFHFRVAYLASQGTAMATLQSKFKFKLTQY